MVKDIIYRDEQVCQIAKKLNIPKSTVTDIWKEYVYYLQERIREGHTVKFLNVCYMVVDKKDDELHETLAYISKEIGDILSVSDSMVYRVLTSFEEYLIHDLRNFYSYCIRGLVRIRLEKFKEGTYHVRLSKSKIYNGNVRVVTLGSFKRKVELN